LYGWLMVLLQPWYRRRLAQRARQEPGYAHAVEERFGHYDADLAPLPGRWVWLHAVSLGETRASAGLVQALRASWPDLRLLLTHGTATGRAEGARLLRAGDVQVWAPWDTPAAVGRFLRQFRPQIGLLMETEVWPNWVHACRQQGVPLLLVNARLSEKSLRQAQRLAALARPAYAGLAGVWAQTQADAQRLRALGANVRGVMGNLKFDVSPDPAQCLRGRTWHRGLTGPVLLLASSRQGEEAAFLDCFESFKPIAPVDQAHGAMKSDVQCWIVPRHPQRFDEVAQLAQARGWQVLRRSLWGDADPPGGMGKTLWLGDSLGEMALYYSTADVALLGGSFEPLGGQNLIEAAACGCPVVMGPHTFNFAEAAAGALNAGAARRAPDMAQAVELALAWVQEPMGLELARAAGTGFAQAHQGAAQRLINALAPLLAR
jgi:3-deoxy-D-manno-octulosonic-acid transferase